MRRFHTCFPILFSFLLIPFFFPFFADEKCWLLDSCLGGITPQPTPPVLREVKRLQTGFILHDIAISPKVDALACAGEGGIALYDLNNFALRWEDSQSYPVNDIIFSPQGEWLASAADDHWVTIWDVKQGNRLHVLGGLPEWATSVAFSPHGDFLAGGSYKTMIIWETVHWKPVAQLQAHQSYIWGLDFADGENSLLASASTDQTINIWQFARPKKEKENLAINLVKTLRASTYWVRSAAFSPRQDVLAAGSADGTLYVWDLNSDEQISTLKGHTGYIWKVAFSPQGDSLISAAEDGKVIIWDWRKGVQRYTIQEKEPVIAVDIARNGYLAIGLRGGTIIVLK